MTTHSKALAAIPVVSALLATLLTACAGGGGSPSIEAMAPPPPAPQQQSSNGCPASSSDLSGLIGCSLGRLLTPGSSGGFSTPSVSFPATNPLSYASWGPWAQTGGITASPTGTLTSPVAIPHSGTADYAGYASANVTYQSTWGVGQMRDYTSQGTAAVHVDFGDASVRATISLPYVEHDIPDYYAYTLPASFTGSVEGNKYGGSRVDQSSIPFRHVNEFSGAFFGPAASETAGTFSTRTFLQEQEVLTIQGSFGAKLCTPGTAGC